MKTAIVPETNGNLTLSDLQVKSPDYIILAYSNNKCIGLIYYEDDTWYFTNSSNIPSAESIGTFMCEDTLTELYNLLTKNYGNVTIKYEATC